jgi:hypothetical protein
MPVGHLKLVLLSPGDTLVMRLEYPIAHAVVTLNNSIIVRGMLWPNSNLFQLTASLAYVLKNGKTTNEHVPKHLPEYIEAAISMGNRQAGDGILGLPQIILSRGDILALRQLKATLKPILLCACEEGICGEMCTCANPNEQRVAGCTIWCHPDATDPRNPSTLCKHLAVTPLTGPAQSTATSTLELVGRAPKVQAEQQVGRKRKKS